MVQRGVDERLRSPAARPVGYRSSRRARDVREDAAGAQAEQRDRDRQEREVVVHDDREDARQRQLGHQQRGGDQRDARQVTRGARGLVLSGAPLQTSAPSRGTCAETVTIRGARVRAPSGLRRVDDRVGAASAAFAVHRGAAARRRRQSSRSCMPSTSPAASSAISSRSGRFISRAHQMPVCARCAGIYFGAAISVIVATSIAPLTRRPTDACRVAGASAPLSGAPSSASPRRPL